MPRIIPVSVGFPDLSDLYPVDLCPEIGKKLAIDPCALVALEAGIADPSERARQPKRSAFRHHQDRANLYLNLADPWDLF